MKLNLLPNYFKKVALIIILVIIAFLIFMKIANPNIPKGFIKPLVKVSIVLAGYFFIMSKEKIEDEFIQSIRLSACAIAFGFIIIQYIVSESNMLYFLSGNYIPTTFKYILNSIFMYIGFFYLLKYRVIKRGKQS